MYLGYFGIRVTDLKKSLMFYQVLLGLKVIKRGDNTKNGGGIYILLADKESGQRLELNWYPKESIFATEYSPGEGLDHIGFRVSDVKQETRRLRRNGYKVIDVPKSISGPQLGDEYSTVLAYVKDPDGNWIELYEHSGSKLEYDPKAY
jgi:lactoylglutathione lyase